MSIICEEVGADASELQDGTEFADFGVDSLLSLNISGRLQEELSISTPSSLFSDYPTVKELKSFLGAGQEQAASPPSGSDSEAVATPEGDSDSEASSVGYETGETSVSEGEDAPNVMKVIRKTIVEEVGIDDNELTATTSFGELGVDSLLGLNVMGTLTETLDMELPQTLFADNDSLQDIENALGLKPKPKSSKPKPAAAPQAPPQTTKPAEDDSPPRATSVLLQGNPKAASKTLFLFPDGSGSATSYASIPKVSSDVAIYGINCPWMKTPQNMKCTYEQLSAKYLAEIRRRQPKGPYYFGGWSAGGISAYDTAQQLTRNGEEVKGLILIDSPNPVGLENPPQKMYDFFDSLDFFGMEGKQPPSWLRPHFDAFLTCLDNYKVEPFVGGESGKALPTHIIYAKDGICKNPDDPRPEIKEDDPREMIWLLNNRTDFSGKGGWADLVGEKNFHAEALEGVNHFSLVAPGPKIEKLSDFIKRAMDA